jgi:TP901 family phage tail tape measure protein
VAAGASIGFGLTSITKDAAGFENVLSDIANTAGEPLEVLGLLRSSLYDISTLSKTAQTPEELAKGLAVLVASGRDLKTEALPSLLAMGRATTATGAGIEDIANTSNAFLSGFKILPESLSKAFDIAAMAGKQGQFELKDMAMFLPSLGARAQKAGLTGEAGLIRMTAALQAVRKSTGTSAEAANYMENLLDGLMSPQVISNFAKIGVNLEASVKDGLSKGVSSLDTVISLVKAKTGGDAFGIARLFQDKQARDALTALIQNEGVYSSVQSSMMSGGKVSVGNVIDTDFEKKQKTAAAGFRAMDSAIFKLKETLGRILAPTLAVIANKLSSVLERVQAFSDANPNLVSGLLVAAGAFAVVMGAVGALGFAVPALVEGWGLLTAAWAWVSGAAAPALVAALGTVSWPVVAIGAAVAALAVVIYKYWEPIKAFFLGLWDGIWEAFAPVWDSLMAAVDEMMPLWDALGEVIASILEPLGLTSSEFTDIMALGKLVGKSLAESVLLFVKPLQWGAEAIGKIGEWMGIIPEGTSKLKKDPATVSLFEHQKKKLVEAGAWKQINGRNELDMGTVLKMVKEGKLSRGGLEALRDGNRMVRSKDALDGSYQGTLEQLVSIQARRDAQTSSSGAESSGGPQKVTNNRTTIHVQSTDPKAAVQEMLRKTQRTEEFHDSQGRGLLSDANHVPAVP